MGTNICKFQERTAAFLSFAVVGWISIIVWARTCSHAQSKCLQDLEKEIDFFDTDAGCE